MFRLHLQLLAGVYRHGCCSSCLASPFPRSPPLYSNIGDCVIQLLPEPLYIPQRRLSEGSLTLTLSNIEFSLPQGSESEPRRWSTRLIFLIMFVASLLLFNVFSASYTSFLSVVQTTQPFSTIQELEATDYKVGAPPGSAYRINFEVTDDGSPFWHLH